MSIKETNREHELIKTIAGKLPRHPDQVNSLLGADAELIRLHQSPEEYLVIKTDGIHEEIRKKLYDDPWLIGWMTVTAPVSDLAAVGAKPTGLLISMVLPARNNDQWMQQFQQGVQEACVAYNTYILGGDTNFDDHYSMNATAVAVMKSKPLLRSGILPGDPLFSTGLLGSGNAYAYSKFFENTTIHYAPSARLGTYELINTFAGGCIDTSDGLFPALSVLSEINDIGFQIPDPLHNLLHPDALNICRNSAVPAWMMLAGPHGEYELLFSVPEKKAGEFVLHCKEINWQPLFIGKATAIKNINFISESLSVQCNPNRVPNIFNEAGGDIQTYFQMLLNQHSAWLNQQ